MFRMFFLVLLLASANGLKAQSTTQYNLSDSMGRRTGQWIEKFPPRMGEEAWAEWGTYDKGRKTGPWYRFDAEARVVAIENFRQGVRNGEAKYFENGTMVVSGKFLGLNPDQKLDTVWVTDPVTEAITRRIMPTDQGSLRDGTWRFYDGRSGRLTRVVEYVLDEIIETKDLAIAPMDSAWYKKREAEMPHNQKRQYRLPRGREGFSLTK